MRAARIARAGTPARSVRIRLRALPENAKKVASVAACAIPISAASSLRPNKPAQTSSAVIACVSTMYAPA